MAPIIADIENTFLPDKKEWYHEKCVGSDSLLITVGDSWTWGDSLGRTNRDFDDHDHRVNHIYGAHLSTMLGCDFINIGIPGGSNLYILDFLSSVLRKMKKTYKKQHIIFTLTESGRELKNNLLDQQSTYLSLAGKDWPGFDQLIAGQATDDQVDLMMSEIADIHFGHVVGLFLALRQSTDLLDLLRRYETYTISAVRQTIKSDVYLARNFTSAFEDSDLDTDLRWVDIISERGSLEKYPDKLYVMSQLGLQPLMDFCRMFEIRSNQQDWLELMDTSSQGIDWLESSPYNSKRATKHPLEQAHLWWAEYLYGDLQS
jgi:hypothetical protein